MKLAEVTVATINDIWRVLEPEVEKAADFETAAQALARELHTRFDDSVVIARVFLTVRFGDLPPSNKSFVEQLVAPVAGAELGATTPVLSLVGTHGREADWCDRRNSQGHVGIPLISSTFVGAIPMISRLLKELGVPLSWVDSHDSESIVEHIGEEAGLFFVEDAGEAVDDEGRKIIAAEGFVSAYDVKSVFGMGGAYPNGQMLAIIVFSCESVPRDAADCFLTLSTLFQDKTRGLVEAGKVFGEA